jgi:hypothetical protein
LRFYGHAVPLEFSPKKSEETGIRVKGELGTGWVQAVQTIDKDEEDIDALDKFSKDHRENVYGFRYGLKPRKQKKVDYCFTDPTHQDTIYNKKIRLSNGIMLRLGKEPNIIKKFDFINLKL